MSPQEVAVRIREIAEQDDGRLRYPIGALAERVVATLLGQDDRERDAYLRAVAGADWWSRGDAAPD